MCSSQELPSRYKELIHYSEESVNKYLKMGSIETAILCGLPIKCEHFNMYAFTLPLAQMSKQTKKKKMVMSERNELVDFHTDC